MDSEKIYKMHEKIGFPPISDKEQADILIWHDVKILNNLTHDFKAGDIPPAVAKRYIKLTKDKFKQFFIKSGYIEKLYDTHLKYPMLDNKWVEKTKDSLYQLKVQVRGVLIHKEYFKNYGSMIDHFVDRLYKSYDY